MVEYESPNVRYQIRYGVNDVSRSKFVTAAKEGDIESVSSLAIAALDDIDNRKKGVALVCAARKGHLNVVRYLVEEIQAPLNATFEYYNPMTAAAHFGCYNVVEFLLDHVVDVKQLETALVLSVRNGKTDVALKLIAVREEKGIDINATDQGADALAEACFYNNDQVLEALIDAGVDIHSIKESDNLAPIHRCGIGNAVKSARVLVRHNVDLNYVGGNANECGTPMLYSIRYGGPSDAFVKVLLDGGADPNFESPLVLAAQKGRDLIVKRLIEHGASINLPNKHKILPLHLAVCKEHYDVVKYILLHCKDVDIHVDCGLFGNGAVCALPVYSTAKDGLRCIRALLAYGGNSVHLKEKVSELTRSKYPRADMQTDALFIVRQLSRKLSACRALSACRRVKMLNVTSDHIVSLIAYELFKMEHPLLHDVQWAIRVWPQRSDWLFCDETELMPVASMVRMDGVVVGRSKEQFWKRCEELGMVLD